MKHQYGRKKLNLKQGHRKALVRNQVIHFIKNGFLQTTKTRIKVIQSKTEKLVTIARQGYTFNVIRRLQQELPYDKNVVTKLIKEIAPTFANRPGGYTRVINLGTRESDTAHMARLEWVK